ncbi:MAG: 3-phosphoshikimate 1-carboxyvinyltransferase [Planctomycetota bacterium]|nr:3-phosphoshikimate 1-carboxyvinyltransferase [Planctomycetota bacterium]
MAQPFGPAAVKGKEVYDAGMNSDQVTANEFWIPPRLPVVRGSVRIEGSKSVAQRVLFNAVLSTGDSELIGVPDNQDLRCFLEALRTLGCKIEGKLPGPLHVEGCGAVLEAGNRQIDLGFNGTGMRFLTAMAALRDGETVIEGARHRPILPLIDALRDLGCEAKCIESGEGPPVWVRGGGLRGNKVVLQAATSSQFTSALMLLAPHLPQGLQIRLVGPISSRPYIDLTAAVLRAFGIQVKLSAREITIAPGNQLRAGKIRIEADASAAAFPLCAAAITSGDVTVEGVGKSSLQGDRSIGEILAEMGCQVVIEDRNIRVSGSPVRAISRVMAGNPDLVPALSVVAAFSRGESIFSGVSHLRVKESDRLAVLCQGLNAVGIRAESNGDLFRVVGSDGSDLRAADLDPQGDHRMAMAFALLALRIPGTRVLQPDCVEKSDPQFFDRLESLLAEPEMS